MRKLFLKDIKDNNFLFYALKKRGMKEVFKHSHDFYEISYVYEGSGILDIGDKKYNFRSHQINFTPPDISHKFTCYPNTSHSQISMSFSKNILKDDTLNFNYKELLNTIEKKNIYVIDVPSEIIEIMEENMDIIYQEYMFKSENYKSLILLKLQTILILMGRIVSKENTIFKMFKNLDPVVYRALQNIESYYYKIQNISDILNNIKMNKKYFITLFKKNVNYTPVNYLNRVKIEKCCEFLITTYSPVTYIAYDCGFNDLSYFNRQFKRFTGMTPKQFRKLAIQNLIDKNKFNRFGFDK